MKEEEKEEEEEEEEICLINLHSYPSFPEFH